MNIDNYIMACHFIGDLPPHRGLFTRGLALPEGRACPRCPHRGLDPGSPANITTEILRRRDYNQKKNSVTLCLCVYSEK